MCHVNNKALIHLNCQYQHSLQSSIPITKTCKKWVMTLSSSMAMYSFMRDIPDARKVPMERGWVALYLYATCNFSNLLTLEQWAFEYGLPLFWYALYSSCSIGFPAHFRHLFIQFHQFSIQFRPEKLTAFKSKVQFRQIVIHIHFLSIKFKDSAFKIVNCH